MYEAEHSYIDFSYTIVAEKIKSFDNTNKNRLKFDDIFYSEFMIKPD